MFIISLVLFIIIVFFNLYVPGILFLKLAKINFSRESELFLASSVGIALFLFIAYISSWIRIPSLLIFLIILAILYAFWKKREIFIPSIFITDWFSIFIIVCGTISFACITFFSGWQTHQGINFIGVNAQDGIMHLGFIKNEVNHFPPFHISLAGYQLRGYHYFYDFFASRFVSFYHFSAEDLQFRLLPLLLSFLYGIGIYNFSSLFTKNIIAKRFILFFAYFGQSFSYILSFFASNVDLGIPQPLTLLLDPSILLAVPILLAGFYIVVQKRKTYYHAFTVALLIGILSEIKIYAGIIGIISLLMYCGYMGVVKKGPIKFYVVVILATAFISAVTFLPNNLGTGGLIFSPFLVYEQFMRKKMFSATQWDLKFDIYKMHHNILKIILLYGEAVGIFWITNSGIRILALLKINKIFQKSFWTNENCILYISLLSSCIIIPSFFIQSYSVFNILQFVWIFFALVSIPVGIGFADIFQKLGKYSFIIILMLFIFTLGDYWNTEKTYFPHSTPPLISQRNAQLLSRVGKLSSDPFLIVLPSYSVDSKGNIKDPQWYPGPLISALTDKNTYFEEEVLAFNSTLSTIAQKREENIYKLVQSLQSCNITERRKMLNIIGSKSIISFTNYPCLAKSRDTLQYISGDNIYFYQLK